MTIKFRSNTDEQGAKNIRDFLDHFKKLKILTTYTEEKQEYEITNMSDGSKSKGIRMAYIVICPSAQSCFNLGIKYSEVFVNREM